MDWGGVVSGNSGVGGVGIGRGGAEAIAPSVVGKVVKGDCAAFGGSDDYRSVGGIEGLEAVIAVGSVKVKAVATTVGGGDGDVGIPPVSVTDTTAK